VEMWQIFPLSPCARGRAEGDRPSQHPIQTYMCVPTCVHPTVMEAQRGPYGIMDTVAGYWFTYVKKTNCICRKYSQKMFPIDVNIYEQKTNSLCN
jgi:hypothetical protein